ncbi:hypothetical protein DM992_39135 [Burkholderia sp. JP2-270]|nr:hypothetical protein DM992_39135 [Burkholderia sp. JP2-270]
MREARQSGAPDGVVLADAGYGDDTSFREAVSDLGLQYAVGIRSNTRVWALGIAPLPPEPSTGKSGRPHSLLRCAPGHELIGVKDLASTLDASRYRNVIWREGTCAALSSRFANEPDRLSRWLQEVQGRLGWQKALVALANKRARIIWALLTRDESFRPDHVPACFMRMQPQEQ